MSEGRHSVCAACKLIGLSRSTYNYKARQRTNKDSKLEAALLEKAEQYPQYSCRRLHELLENEGLVVNLRRMYKLYSKHGLASRKKKRERK